MDRRYEAFQTMHREAAATSRLSREDASAQSLDEATRLAQVMRDGQQSDIWTQLMAQMDALIVQAERKFVDTLAPDYQTYVQWWARRQAVIGVVALPQKLIMEAETLRLRTERGDGGG